MNHAYFAPEAIGSPYNYFFDGTWYYERAYGLGSLGALDGWLKRIGRGLKKAVKKVGNGVKKVAKKVGKVVKKVGKVAVKVIKKALPIVNTALSFIPGVGWAVKAGLTLAEEGLKAVDRAKKRKELRAEAARLNKARTIPVKKANPVMPVNNPGENENKKPKTTIVQPVAKTQPVFTTMDYIKIQRAVQKDRVTPDQVAALTRKQVNESLMQILNS